jgi:uncharacterized membrane protein
MSPHDAIVKLPVKIMDTKIVLWLVLLVFVGYTLLLAPLDQPGTLTLIEKLVKLQWVDINPILGLRDSRIFWAVTLVPLLGALAYLCLRPPLPESSL